MTIGGDGADLECTNGAACVAATRVLRAGVAGQAWDLVDADIAADTMVIKTVTKTTAANGASADGAAVYRSVSWDATDIYMGASPGITEAAFETALAAVTNATTDVSGMLRTVATGTGTSVFSIG